MKAIVTGGQGFIGHNLCKKLRQDNWSVQVFDDLSTGSELNVVDGVEYNRVSILCPEFINTVINIQPEVIFHLAALPRVSYSVEHPVKTTQVNTLGTVSVLEAARCCTTPVRVVSTSSSSVYGGASELPTPEETPCDPQSPYALQKFQSEQWCKMYSSLYGLDVVSLRYFNVFGPYSRFGGAYSTVLSAWLYNLFFDENYTPFLEGDGSQSRDFCFVDNVVQANVLAATSAYKFNGEAFNVAQGSAHTLLECKELIESIAGKTLTLEQRPERVGDIEHTLADISLVGSRLGYKPTTDFKSQVLSMADWYAAEYRHENITIS